MQFYPKDKDPRLDERSARFHARVLKEDLATLSYVPNTCNRDINIARASTYVVWDYDKEMWCETDHLLMHFYIKARTSDTRDELEDKINRDVVELIKGPRYYEQAKVYCMIDMHYPEDESIYDIVKKPKKDRNPYGISGDEGEVTYHVSLHVQECNAMDLAIYDEPNRGDYFDLSGNNLESPMKDLERILA
tara:strand:- start:1201 stop:1773 length:573 start_codon:yes stop_codon:yes gene_type:complete